MNIVYHCRAFGFIDRFLELKCRSPLNSDDDVVVDPAVVVMQASNVEDSRKMPPVR